MKLKLSLILIISIFFYSCEGTISSDFSITKSDLVGTWSLTNFEMENVNLLVTSVTPNETIVAYAQGKNYNASINLSENPDIASVSGDFTLEIKYNQTNVDIYTLDAYLFTDIFGASSSTWNYSNHVLSLSENGNLINIDVIDFTGTILKVEMDVNETVTINGITSNVTGSATITLEK